MSDCTFLTDAELDALIEGKLAVERLEAFRAHAMDCDACALLAADVDVMRDLAEHGPSERELSEYRSLEPEAHGAAGTAAAASAETASSDAAPVPRAGGYRWLAVAAMLIVAVGLGVLLRPVGPGGPSVELPGGERLRFEAMVFDAPPTLRGQPDLEQLWQQAREAYDSQNWSEAAGVLEQVEALDPEDSDAALYRGIALLMTDRYDEAVEALARSRRLKQELEDPLSAPLWFEALAHLGADRPAEALPLLDRAAETGGAYASDAREVAQLVREAP